MPLHIAFNLITSLEKCKCPVCQKELKKIKEKYGLDQVNKGQDMKKIIDFGSGHLESKLSKFVDGKLDANEYKISYQPERLNPEDIRNNVSDSPTSENK